LLQIPAEPNGITLQPAGYPDSECNAIPTLNQRCQSIMTPLRALDHLLSALQEILHLCFSEAGCHRFTRLKNS